MSEFYVGQKVACVNASSAEPPHSLVQGQIYVVRWVGPYSDWTDENPGIGILVEGQYRFHEDDGEDVPFGSYRFKPLESKGVEIFRAIAKGVTDKRPIIEDAEYREPKPVRITEMPITEELLRNIMGGRT